MAKFESFYCPAPAVLQHPLWRIHKSDVPDWLVHGYGGFTTVFSTAVMAHVCKALPVQARKEQVLKPLVEGAEF